MNRPADDRTHVEYLVLAEAVENVDGKLNLTGGDWDTLFVADIERPVAFPFTCGVIVPWAEADREHRLAMSVAGADGRSVAARHDEAFRVGRSRLAGPDDPAHQRFTIRWEVIFPGYGPYGLTATVDGRADDARRVAFSVLPPPAEPVISEEEMNIIDEELANQL